MALPDTMKKKLTVSYAPGNVGFHPEGQTPMIRIANRFLLKAGFQVGDRAEIEYGEGTVVITRKNPLDI